MSVLEDLRAFEQRLVARIAELQPVVEEYEELKRAAERLGIDVTTASGQPRQRPRAKAKGSSRTPRRRVKAAASRGSSGLRRPGGTRATGAERRERVLALIAGKPGITVREMSEEMGVDAPQLYRVVRKLQSEGRIKKEGTSLTPA
jgi:hypothetical protein